MNSLYDRVALTVAGAGTGLVTRQARNTLIGAWCVLTLLIGTSVGIQAFVYVWNKGEEVSQTHVWQHTRRAQMQAYCSNTNIIKCFFSGKPVH